MSRRTVCLAFALVSALAPQVAHADGAPTIGVTARVPIAPKRIAAVKGSVPTLEGLVAAHQGGNDPGDPEDLGSTTLSVANRAHRCFDTIAPGQSTQAVMRTPTLTLATGADVTFVRSEWLRLDADKNAHLEREDFWFDPRTRGMTQVERSTVELVPLAGAVTGSTKAGNEQATLVYGYRDGDTWHLVMDTGDTNSTIQDHGIMDVPERCGHAHVLVDARAPGGGSTAAITLGPVSFRGKRRMTQRTNAARPLRVVASASRGSRDVDAVLSIVMVPRKDDTPDDDEDELAEPDERDETDEAEGNAQASGGAENDGSDDAMDTFD